MALSANRLFAPLFAGFFGALAGRRKPQPIEAGARILCFTGAGMGDTLDTFPLLHALRRHFPQAHLTVACDPLNAPMAQACPAVDEVIVLKPGWTFAFTALRNGFRLQNHDWALAAKGGFDSRLAALARLSNAAVRIGFERRADRPSAYFSDPVALPDEPNEEHQIETILRLLKPLGLVNPRGWTVDLSLRVPDSAVEYASEILAQPPFDSHRALMLINLSSTDATRFREEDFIALIGRVLGTTNFAIGLVAAPADQTLAEEIAACMGSKRIAAIDVPEPIVLAALLEQANFLLTPEDGAAHLAAAVGAPAVVLWPGSPSPRTHSRGRRHVFIHAEPGEKAIPVMRVWNALQPFLAPE